MPHFFEYEAGKPDILAY